MRKDKGLNGDVDRLPMLTWIMFLKFLDDMERVRSDEAALGGQAVPTCHRCAISLAGLEPANSDSRRRRPAQRDDGRRADRVHQPGRGRPAGRRARPRALRLPAGAGWWWRHGPRATSSPRCSAARSTGCSPATSSATYQQGRAGSTSRRRRRSTRSATCTSRCCKEMRDAAGDSGEFYTPRPLVRMIVRAVDPKPGETSSTRPPAPAGSWSRRTSTCARSRDGRGLRAASALDALRDRGQAAARTCCAR